MEYGYFAMKPKADDARRKVAIIISRCDFLNDSLPNKGLMVKLYDYMRQYYQNNTAWRSNFCSVWETVHKRLKVALEKDPTERGEYPPEEKKEKLAILTVLYANTKWGRKKAKKGLLKVMQKDGTDSDYEKKFDTLEGNKTASNMGPVKTVKNPNLKRKELLNTIQGKGKSSAKSDIGPLFPGNYDDKDDN